MKHGLSMSNRYDQPADIKIKQRYLLQSIDGLVVLIRVSQKPRVLRVNQHMNHLMISILPL